MLHNGYPVNWGEPAASCGNASMAYNDKKEEPKRAAGSRMSA